MGWIILMVVVVLLLVGFTRGSSTEAQTDSSDSDEREDRHDDEMLEDWYTSQELDNDLDDWDR